jgi:two-component system cell cycle sensor histidine kinase/response regulator CckA
VIDLVVSDVVMPQMGGLALYRALQARRPDVRMLFVTGHPLQGEEQVLLEQGQVNWLQKPFTVLEFGRAVAGMLNA